MNRLLAIALLVLTALPAWGGELRLGVFVGNNVGRPNEAELLFAASDAKKMRDTFSQFGDLQDQPRSDNIKHRHLDDVAAFEFCE